MSEWFSAHKKHLSNDYGYNQSFIFNTGNQISTRGLWTWLFKKKNGWWGIGAGVGLAESGFIVENIGKHLRRIRFLHVYVMGRNWKSKAIFHSKLSIWNMCFFCCGFSFLYFNFLYFFTSIEALRFSMWTFHSYCYRIFLKFKFFFSQVWISLLSSGECIFLSFFFFLNCTWQSSLRKFNLDIRFFTRC